MTRDPFEFDDYFTQDYVATIEKVEFVVSDYNNLQAIFRNRYDEPVSGNDGELRTDRPEFYSIGSADLWRPTNGGTAFEHESRDPDKRIKSSTGYGKMVMRTMELVGKEGIVERLDPALPNGGLYAAGWWTGLRFHWVTEGAGKTWKNSKTGESGTSKGHQLPVEYLPSDGSGSSQSTVREEYDVAGLGLDVILENDLRTFAQGLSLGEFQSKGISLLRELTDDEMRGKLTAALSDPSFYGTLRPS